VAKVFIAGLLIKIKSPGEEFCCYADVYYKGTIGQLK